MGSPAVLLCRICGSTTDGDTFVDIFSTEGEKNQLEQKHSALSKHVSQMTKTYDDENFTLKEIGNGEWLSVLLTDYEVFKRQR